VDMNWQQTSKIYRNIFSLSENVAKIFRGLHFLTHCILFSWPIGSLQSGHSHKNS